MIKLNQEQNYAADFGLVFRSSAIFAVIPEAQLTISILNYWKLKNSIEVTLVISQRTTAGHLVDRSRFDFLDCNILNFSPTITAGSVEVEAFSNQNARIPYAAVMGIYETGQSISMVHAYGRNHSASEIEERRAVLEARESCITLRADKHIVTDAFFHNGNVAIEEQEAKLILTSQSGDESEIVFTVHELGKYETFIFEFEKIAPDFREFLGGKDGWATLHFCNHSAFPRLLVRWLNRRDGTIQVTHSNFDYTQYQTNTLETEKAALMVVPDIKAELCDKSAIIYPRSTPGVYRVSCEGGNCHTAGGTIVKLPTTTDSTIRIAAQSGKLPSRIVTAISGQVSPEALPFECSLGVLHDKRPPKRFHWGVVSNRHESIIYITKYAEFYRVDDDIRLTFCLHGSVSGDVLTCELTYPSLAEVPGSFCLKDLFPECDRHLDGYFGYFTLFSNWGGFLAFTSLQLDGSLTLEHSF